MANEQNAPATPTVTAAQPAEIRRRDNFVTSYANHVQVESNAFDLKLIFGLMDHRNALKPAVEQFASLNLAWPEVKLLIFWMQVHLAGYERENGKVKIPTNAIPPDFPSLPPQFDNPQGREAVELIRKMRAEFIAELSKT